jgi:hypothetical protein
VASFLPIDAAHVKRCTSYSMKHKKICPLEKFLKYRDELVEQIRAARMHYDLYCNLRGKVGEYTSELNQAPNFWSLTLNAHIEALCIALCRVYDQEKSSLGLHLWLKLFHDELLSQDHSDKAFCDKKNCKPLSVDELKANLQQVSPSDPLVKKLVVQRGSAIAHVSAKMIANSSSGFEAFPLAYPDLEELLVRSEYLLNRYSVLTTGCAFTFLSFQNLDFQTVLESIRSASGREV